MTFLRFFHSTALLVATFSLVFGFTSRVIAQNVEGSTEEKVSRFGKYSGYSEEKYDQWVVTSRYVEMRDGVKLAMDIIRPSSDGKQPADEKVPVIWTHSRYHRNQQAMAPQLKSMVDGRPDLQRLVRHGYAIATVGVRGSGASFGRFEGLFSPNETQDAYEVIDFLSKQPWCNGNVGMFGGSYLGMTQYMAASKGHPALKAIFPNVAGFDLYDTIHPGGVFRRDMIQHWDQLTTMLDTKMTAASVDGDSDGKLLKQAISEHDGNWEVLEGYEQARFRNSQTPDHSYSTHNPVGVLEAVNQFKVPAYHWNGFQDIFVSDAALWYANYAGPQKMGIGPWPHSVYFDRRFIQERMKLQEIEQHRWFDHWLKSIDNGIMDEPPINYAILDEDKTWHWTKAKTWPPTEFEPRTFYFTDAKSGSIESVNDGKLQLDRPSKDDSHAKYTVDLTTTTGTASRWDNAVGQGPLKYGDLSNNDRKSLTFTSDPLTADVTVAGHPVATLYASCSVDDCVFHVLLEEVDEDGKSNYVSEAVLRASQRKTSKAPFNNLGLPFQRCHQSDKEPLEPGKTTEIKMDLHPVALIFNEGNRIRVTIMCADRDNLESLKSSDGAEVRIQHNPEFASQIQLPIKK